MRALSKNFVIPNRAPSPVRNLLSLEMLAMSYFCVFHIRFMFIRHIFISGLELSFYKVSLWSANRAGAQAL